MSRLRPLVLALVALAVWAPTAAAQAPEDATFASGFNAPTAIALAPDGRVFVAEQGGTVRVVKDGAVLRAAVRRPRRGLQPWSAGCSA